MELTGLATRCMPAARTSFRTQNYRQIVTQCNVDVYKLHIVCINTHIHRIYTHTHVIHYNMPHALYLCIDMAHTHTLPCVYTHNIHSVYMHGYIHVRIYIFFVLFSQR